MSAIDMFKTNYELKIQFKMSVLRHESPSCEYFSVVVWTRESKLN